MCLFSLLRRQDAINQLFRLTVRRLIGPYAEVDLARRSIEIAISDYHKERTC
jgi:hypothetical protein